MIRSEDDARAAVVTAAAGEIGASNPARYWSEVLSPNRWDWPRHWCGAFALWALVRGGVAPPSVRWEIGRGFLYRLPRTTAPKRGDIAYFDQPYQHHAVVEAIEQAPNGRVLVTIDGNSGAAPGTVARTRRDMRTATAFYSITPWIEGMSNA